AFHRTSFDLRKDYWSAAWHMFGSSPIAGKGLDRYAAYFRIYQPKGFGLRYPVGFTNNAAHSVPLHMLATGGVILGLGYLAFVVVVSASLVRGLASSDGTQRLLVGGLGGAWVAYVVQSSVSIDVVPIALVGWLLAGATVLLG